MANASITADVLIVGAGPVGLALASELTMRGHTVRIVEKNDRTGVQPRAKTTNIRTMTHMRRWGLAAEMRKRSPLAADFPRDVTFRTGLFDDPIYTFHDAFCASPQQYDAFPEHAEFIPQYVVEGILADHVQRQPNATLEFGTILTGFTHDDHGVEATLKDTTTGQRETIRTHYIVGADGGRSFVRKTLGIEMQGTRNILHCSTLILRIPGLDNDPDLKKGLFHWILNPDNPSFIGPMDRGDLWYWSRVCDPDATTEDLLKDAQAVVGRGYAIEVVTRDNWVVHSLIADRYREGGAFLAGDACHLHSPFGGHGMNQGIGDAVDLGWKLSAALEGWATEGLLDSYTLERQQANRAIVDSATKNAASLSYDLADPKLLLQGEIGDSARADCARAIKHLKKPEFQSAGLVLGHAYVNSPAIADEPGNHAPMDISHYVPSARPGCLAPHLWIDDETSIYDLFAKGFTLLNLADTDADAEDRLLSAASEQCIPVEILQLANVHANALYQANYVLIRPDQYVAWRGDTLPEPKRLLNIMTGGDPQTV